jgi:hypothetical protein
MLDRIRSRQCHGRWWILPFLAGAVLSLGGCHKAGNPASDVGTGRDGGERVDMARDGIGARDGIAWRNEDGALAAARRSHLALPDEFPVDVYRPRRYTVNTVLDLGGTSTVSMRAPGQVTSLFADARAAMRAQGWTQVMAAQHSVDNAVLAFEKAQRSATLSFNRAQDPDGVIVSVQLQRH